MDVKKLALLVGALVIAVITAVMAKNMFAGAGAQQANAAPAVPLGPKVLVAKKAPPVGTIVDTGDFKFDPTPVMGGPTDERRYAPWGPNVHVVRASASSRRSLSPSGPPTASSPRPIASPRPLSRQAQR